MEAAPNAGARASANIDRLRIAIVSSPRSGNTWIRSVLAGALNAGEIAVHNYIDAPEILPQRCLVQIHWYREPNFQKWLRDNGFSIITISRNPFDILISALRFAKFEPETSRWLEGNTGLPGGLSGANPTSEKFLRYALSFEAENLLSVTYHWWHQKNIVRLRYEDVVQNPVKVLGNVVSALGGEPSALLPMLEDVSLAKMKSLSNQHGWQGRPGLWKELITPFDAFTIWRRHRRVFQTLGYPLRPYVLSQKTALENWRSLA